MTTPGPSRIVAHGAMSLLYFLLMAGTFNTLGVVLTFMAHDLGFTWAQSGWGFTLLGVTCGAASLVPAAAIRRIGLAATLVFGGLVLAGGFGLLALAHSAGAYYAGTALLGFGFCLCGTVPGTFVIARLFERRATALGLYFTIGGLGSVFGPLIFLGVQRVAGDWRPFWLLFAAVALALGLFAALVTARAGPDAAADQAMDEAAGGWSARDALASPHYWIVVAAYTGCLLINTTLHNFAAQHIVERGLGQDAVGWLMSAVGLVGSGAAIIAGRLGERFSPRSLTLLAVALLGASAMLLVVPQGWPTLGLFALAFGAGLGCSYVATAMLLLDFFGRRPNLELYSLMCVVSTVAAIGPAIGGRMRDASGSFASTFDLLGGVAVLLFAVLLATRAPGPGPRRAGLSATAG